MTIATRVSSRRQPKKVTLNKSTIAALKVPASGRVYYHDSRTPGLCCCVTAAGSKVFYLYRWHDSRPLRQRLGATDEITVEQARDQAKAFTGEQVRGVDTQARKRAAREELTFGELFGSWMEYATAHKRTACEDQRQYNKFLATWSARRLSDIDSTDIQRLHNRVRVQSGPYQANRLIALVKSVFNRAIDLKTFKGDNPVPRKFKKFEEHKRERPLQVHEMQQFFKALGTLSPDHQDVFLLLLLTGARRGSVLKMRWVDIDLPGATWVIPAAASKNKKPVVVSLVPRVVEILKARQNLSEFVFPGAGRTGHLGAPKAAWHRLVTSAGLAGLRQHDMRHTLATMQANQGVSQAIIGASLGHAPGSAATSGYMHLNREPVRLAVTNATEAILKAGLPAPPKAPKKAKRGSGNGKKTT